MGIIMLHMLYIISGPLLSKFDYSILFHMPLFVNAIGVSGHSVHWGTPIHRAGQMRLDFTNRVPEQAYF